MTQSGIAWLDGLTGGVPNHSLLVVGTAGDVSLAGRLLEAGGGMAVRWFAVPEVADGGFWHRLARERMEGGTPEIHVTVAGGSGSVASYGTLGEVAAVVLEADSDGTVRVLKDRYLGAGATAKLPD